MQKNEDGYRILYYISARLLIFSYPQKFNPSRGRGEGKEEERVKKAMITH